MVLAEYSSSYSLFASHDVGNIYVFWPCSNSATFPNHCAACLRLPHNVLHSPSIQYNVVLYPVNIVELAVLAENYCFHYNHLQI